MEIYADLGTLGIFNYRIPPPWKFMQILALWVFSITEYPPQWKFMQILALWVFSITEYPPWVFLITEYPPLKGSTHTHIYYAITHTYTMPSSVHCG